MKCEKCHKPIRLDKEYRVNICDKFILILEKPNYYETNPKVYVLFEKMISYIKQNENLDLICNSFTQITGEVVVKCEFCGFDNKIDSLNFAYAFFNYVCSYIDFIFDNIITKYTNKKVEDFSIKVNESNFDTLFDNLPNNFESDRQLLEKLYYIKYNLPIIGGSGGPELLEWLLDEFKLSIFSIILSLIITGGIEKINELVKKIKIKTAIKKIIKSEEKYWKNISVEDIIKYISIPKDFNGSKEELIEQILKAKFEEYKNEIIEKLR
jgi:hypothetical protein